MPDQFIMKTGNKCLLGLNPQKVSHIQAWNSVSKRVESQRRLVLVVIDTELDEDQTAQNDR